MISNGIEKHINLMYNSNRDFQFLRCENECSK